MQCLEHTCYEISIADDHIISCLKPGRLGHWVDHILLPVPSRGTYESKDACPERRRRSLRRIYVQWEEKSVPYLALRLILPTSPGTAVAFQIRFQPALKTVRALKALLPERMYSMQCDQPSDC